MKIGRLNIQLTGDATSGRDFARHFSTALARNLPAAGTGHRIDKLSVPAIQARPGESPRRLAERTAAKVAETLLNTNKGAGS